MRKLLIAICFVMIVGCSPPAGNNSPNLKVQLGELKVEGAKLKLQEEERELRHAEEVCEKLKGAGGGAIPERSIMDAEEKCDVARLKVKQAQNGVRQAEVELEMAKRGD